MATRRPLVLVGGELKELPAGDTMLSALLGATTVGDGLLKLPNPGALSFLRINADDTVSALAAADFRSAIGAGTSSFDGAFSSLSGRPTITGTANQVIVTNGDGTAGNPTLSLPQSIATTSTPLFAGVGVNGAAASFRLLQFYTGGVRRINVGTDGAGESGANAGSNFQINRFDDAGNSLGAALFIQRSTSNVGIGTTSPQTLLHVGSGNESPAATNPGALKVHTSGAELESVGGIELPVATNGYSVKIQGVSDSGASLVFANRAASATWTERMRINAAGNVGIGTIAPAARLDLGASAGVVQYVYKDGSANAGLGINLSGNNGELSLFAGATGNDAGRISFGRRRVDTGTYTERMVVDGPSGAVGIGTSSPAAQLHLRSGSVNIAEAIRIDNPTNYTDNGSKIVWRNADVSNDAAFFGARRIGASTGMALTFGTAAAWSTAAATEKMRIAGNGNVGIGNTNPLRKLDVVGDAKGNGIRVTGTTGTIGAFTAEGTSINLQADTAVATRVLVDAGTLNASGYAVINGGSSGYVQLSTGGTARLQAFANGTVSVPGTLVVNSGASPAGSARNITISTSAPSGGADGDVWLQYTA